LNVAQGTDLSSTASSKTFQPTTPSADLSSLSQSSMTSTLVWMQDLNC